MSFEPLEEYGGDILRIDRLIEFLPTEHWEWDGTGSIDLNDISIARHEGLPEISDPYGDTWKYPVLEHRTRDWHIGRILYFIKHPNEAFYFSKSIEKNLESLAVDIYKEAAFRWYEREDA